MEALIIVAHGSKVKSSNDEIVEIVSKIKSNIDDSILVFQAITNAIAENCKKIKIFPYFLAAGKHVQEDIPYEIKKFKKQYPEIEFILLPHIGQCNGIEDMIISNL
jgi:sirohydrochlorin cobaltochelatase